MRKEIEEFISSLEETAVQFQDELPANAEAVLQIEEHADVRWQYYIADLDEKKMIWMHNFDASWIANLVDGVDHLQQLSPLLISSAGTQCQNEPVCS